jgi:transcriptional regulator with XRE-family HTH domain
MASHPIQAFAALLRRHRLLAGLSQEALAERAGLSVRGISDLERGVRRAPHPATISRLAEALDLDDSARKALLLTASHMPLPGAAAVEPPPSVVGATPVLTRPRRCSTRWPRA